MSGCIHKNRMCVIYMCQCHELSCKFYDKMSKICCIRLVIRSVREQQFRPHTLFKAHLLCSMYRCNSIAETLIIPNSLAMCCVYVSYSGFDNKKVVISFGFGCSFAHLHTLTVTFVTIFFLTLSLFWATMFQHNIAVSNVIPCLPCLTK